MHLHSTVIEFQTVSLVFDLSLFQKHKHSSQQKSMMIKVKCAMTRNFLLVKETSHLLPTLVNYLLFVLLAQIFVLQKWSIYISFALLCDYCFPYTVVGCPWKVCVCVCMVAHALVRVGDGVHFDAQFKVGWHYLFMPLLFLFPLRVENSWRSILGRSRLTQTESIASPLNACARTFRRCCLSIRLPSWLLFVGPLISDSNSPFTLLNLL